MAIVQFGAIVTEIRGKVGNYVYSRNRGGAYVKALGSWTDPATASQIIQRGYLSKAVEFWAKMSAPCKLAWEKYAQVNPYQINIFHYSSIAGYNAFISAFLNKCIAVGFPFNNITVNGDFAIDSNWSKGAGWTIGSGTANFNGTSNKYLIQITNQMVLGEKFFGQFDITAISANYIGMFIAGGTTNGQILKNSIGTHSGYFNINTLYDTLIYFYANNTLIGSIDNVYLMTCNQFPEDLL
jgi:hypothetical protein